MILLLLGLFVVFFYFYATNQHNYWAKRNVKHDSPIPLFGNHLHNLLKIKSATEIATEYYNRFPGEKVVGYYHGTTPELIIRDLDLARQILSADFAFFYPRGLGRDPKREPLFGNLFHSDGDKWRLLRKRLTPAFTTAKLRAMFPLVENCAKRLQILIGKGGVGDALEYMARFTTEFIGACGFGIEMNTINNERSQFRDLGKLIFHRPMKHRVRFLFWNLFPELRKILYVGDPKVEESLTQIVQQIREQRNFKPIGRNDFIDLLLELENLGKIIGESIEQRNPDGTPVQVEMEIDLKYTVAQVLLFFVAGFETSSSATSFTLHILAFNSDVQSKIQQEIDTVILKHDNKLCYDAVCEMTLLDMAFKEAMRIFPPLGTLNRVCARRYTIPGLDITIDPGVKIVIPVQAIHLDEQYFENPTDFRPQRFAPGEAKKRHKYSYLPFGEGPRACIGAKLGEMQSMAGLAAVLHKFSVEPAASTQRDISVSPASNLVQRVKGGLPLNFKLRKKKTG